MRFAHLITVAATLLAGCIFSIDERKIDESKISPTDDGGTPPRDGMVPSTDAADARTSIEGPTDGLIGLWSFSEPSGTAVTDESGSGNDGVLEGVVSREEGAPGHGQGISTNANTQLGAGMFRVPSLDGARFPRRGTLSLWLRARRAFNQGGTFGDSNAFFFARTGTVPDGRFINLLYVFDTAAQERVVAGIIGPGTANAEAIVFPVVRGSWTHVVVTWSGDQVTLFGGMAGKALVSNASSYTDAFDPVDQQFFLLKQMFGDLDEVRLYDRALDDAEVRAIP